jgi:hypothetical protein
MDAAYTKTVGAFTPGFSTRRLGLVAVVVIRQEVVMRVGVPVTWKAERVKDR